MYNLQFFSASKRQWLFYGFVAFTGNSHVECMDKLKQWLEVNKSWVNKTDND